MEILCWSECHPGAPLLQGPKLPRNINGARLGALEEAIARAAQLPIEQWPEIKRRDRDQAPRNDCKEEIDALRSECARIARELEISASTLAPRAALEAIARMRPRTLDEIMSSGGLLRWQAELVQGAVERFSQASH